MTRENMIADFQKSMQAKVDEFAQKLRINLDLAVFEGELREMMAEFEAQMIQSVLEEILSDKELEVQLRKLGGRLGICGKEYKSIRIRLSNGKWIWIEVLYFTKAKSKGGKRRKRYKGGYLVLDVLGLIQRHSPSLVSHVVESALLCPSMVVAETLLSRRGIEMDDKTIRQLCQVVGQRALPHRGRICLDGTESVKGRTVLIGVDGGRIRERARKRGRKPKGHKRQGFHTDWREPKMFIILVLDEEGKVVREFAPLQDATMGNHHALFDLLQSYLQCLDLLEADKVVFCGDGSEWIWSGVEAVITRLGLDRTRVFQVLDHPHAKQNLAELIELLPEEHRKAQQVLCRNLLWQGNIDAIGQSVLSVVHEDNKEKASNKWKNYFKSNQHRMQYQAFRNARIPCGSGYIESAIRRVINLRLKAPGTFWLKHMAEVFLFLRSQLLSRWQIFFRNLTSLTRNLLPPSVPQPSSLQPAIRKAA